jgi:hypothetical protein
MVPASLRAGMPTTFTPDTPSPDTSTRATRSTRPH